MSGESWKFRGDGNSGGCAESVVEFAIRGRQATAAARWVGVAWRRASSHAAVPVLRGTEPGCWHCSERNLPGLSRLRPCVVLMFGTRRLTLYFPDVHFLVIGHQILEIRSLVLERTPLGRLRMNHAEK